jgi:hypothetical protein
VAVRVLGSADDLAGGIDGEGFAGIAAEGPEAEIWIGRLAEDGGEGLARTVLGFADDLAGGVDGVGFAVAATEGAEVDVGIVVAAENRGVVVSVRVGCPADDDAGVIDGMGVAVKAAEGAEVEIAGAGAAEKGGAEALMARALLASPSTRTPRSMLPEPVPEKRPAWIWLRLPTMTSPSPTIWPEALMA